MTTPASQPPQSVWRLRSLYAVNAVAVVALGLLVRSHRLPLSGPLVKYSGDALWALMVYLLLRGLQPRQPLPASAAAALAIAWLVEFSQLLRFPWLVSLRHTRVGHLVLGSTFNAPDLLAYLAGIAVGLALDSWRASITKSGP